MTTSKITRILLIGITGSGKSASASLILGRVNPDGSIMEVFKVNEGVASVTKVAQRERFTLNGQTYEIIDTQGVLDTSDDQTLVRSRITDAIKDAQNIDIIAFVVRQGRITQDVLAALLYMSEAILGKESAANSILIVTGASHETVMSSDAQKKWITDATSLHREMYILLKAINYRVKFVCNPPADTDPDIETKLQGRRRDSRYGLIQLFQHWPAENKPPYSFHKASEAQKKYDQEVEAKRKQMEEATDARVREKLKGEVQEMVEKGKQQTRNEMEQKLKEQQEAFARERADIIAQSRQSGGGGGNEMWKMLLQGSILIGTTYLLGPQAGVIASAMSDVAKAMGSHKIHQNNT